jgi:hypothetical protein
MEAWQATLFPDSTSQQPRQTMSRNALVPKVSFVRYNGRLLSILCSASLDTTDKFSCNTIPDTHRSDLQDIADNVN